MRAASAPRGRLGRRSILLGAVGAVGVVPAACAPGAAGQSSSSTAPAALEIWHPWDAAREAFFTQVVADFQKLHPNITINATLFTYDVLAPKYLAATAAGTAPPISYLERQDYLAYALRKIIDPLDALAKQEKISLTEYYEGDLKNATYQGKLYLLPAYVGSGRSLLWRNKKLFADAGLDPNTPPRSWDEFEAAERKLTIKDGTELKRVAFTGENFKRWLYSAGGKWDSDDGRTVTFHNGPAADAVEWVKRRTDAIYGGNAARGAFGAARGAAAQRGGFFTGEVAMTISHHGILFDQSQYAKDMQMGVSAAPVMRPELPPAVAEFFAGYGITSGTKTPSQAMQFVKYISYDDAGVGWFFRQQLRPSPIKKQNQHPDLRKLNPDWDTMLAAMARDVGVANTGADRDIDPFATAVFNDALNGKQVARQGLTESAAAAQQKVDAFWASIPGGGR
jgi:multiple sugar transport system substrate-binding protein